MFINLRRRLLRLPAGWLFVAAFFLFWAVVQTWPLVLHATDSIINWPHRPEDSWQYLWDLWWVKHSLLSLSNPFHTDNLFYPQGADLYLHTLTTVNGVMSIPLQVVTGNVILSWNLLAIILFVLSGLTTYALSRRITGNGAAALVSAYIFTFSPFVLMRLHGHWNISTTWLLPLFPLFLLRFHDSGRLREALFAGACWALIAYNSLEYAIDAGLFLGLFLVYWSLVHLRARDWARLPALWRGLPVIAGAGLILGAPLLIPALLSVQSGDVSLPPGSESLSSDLAALVTPSALWGPGELPAPVPPGVQHFPAGDIENTVFLGFTALLLGALAVLSIRRLSGRAVFWAVVFVFFVALAMGPHLYVGDTKEFSLLGVSFTVPMPYQIYDKIPVISSRRGISRMIVFGHLWLSVLAGIGVDVLQSWLRGRSWLRGSYKQVVPLAAVVILGLVILEYWNPPNAISRLETPAVFEAIADEPGDFAILDAPVGRSTWTLSGSQPGALLADYYARIYGKPTVGGYLSRAPNEDVTWLDNPPGIKYLACPAQCPRLPDANDRNAALVKDTFRKYRIKYVALHYITPHGWPVGGAELTKLDGYIRTVLQFRQVYKDNNFTLFQDPDFPASGG